MEHTDTQKDRQTDRPTLIFINIDILIDRLMIPSNFQLSVVRIRKIVKQQKLSTN